MPQGSIAFSELSKLLKHCNVLYVDYAQIYYSLIYDDLDSFVENSLKYKECQLYVYVRDYIFHLH